MENGKSCPVDTPLHVGSEPVRRKDGPIAGGQGPGEDPHVPTQTLQLADLASGRTDVRTHIFVNMSEVRQ